MLAPDSDNFRAKALAAFERGKRKIEVYRLLGISRNTLDLWLKQREKIGSICANRNC